LASDRKLVVARPLVPGAGVVARVVAGGAKGHRGEPRPRARVTVGDDARLFGQPCQPADLFGEVGPARTREERADLDQTRSRDVPLPPVARVASAARVLIGPSHVDDCEGRIVEAAGELLQRWER